MNPTCQIARSKALMLLGTLLAVTAVVARAAELTAAKPPVAAGDRQPITEFVDPPPLDSAIIEWVKTNCATASVEARIDAVQKAKFTATEKAQALLVIFPSLDRQSQRKVAHALVKFVDDSSYGLIRRQLMDTKLHPQVLSVFMTDTLKRQNRIKIPVLLALARVETHPLKSEARELLAAYVRQDHGTNWAQWDSTVNAWLMQNPG